MMEEAVTYVDGASSFWWEGSFDDFRGLVVVGVNLLRFIHERSFQRSLVVVAFSSKTKNSKWLTFLSGQIRSFPKVLDSSRYDSR